MSPESYSQLGPLIWSKHLMAYSRKLTSGLLVFLRFDSHKPTTREQSLQRRFGQSRVGNKRPNALQVGYSTVCSRGSASPATQGLEDND